MTRYIIRRLLQAIPLLIILSAVLFFLAMEMGVWWSQTNKIL
jgi:ABC-type dipeptide/oligopeptide/nickel transport system permease component